MIFKWAYPVSSSLSTTDREITKKLFWWLLLCNVGIVPNFSLVVLVGVVPLFALRSAGITDLYSEGY